MSRILVADVGGTNARFAIATLGPDGIALSDSHTFPSASQPSLEAAALAYRARVPDVALARASIAIAGPVKDGVARVTNLPWVVEATKLSAALGVPARVMNDFEAIARGVRHVPASLRVTLQEGSTDARAPVAILGAGTGLGEALMLGDVVLPSEGGHASFAPNDDDEASLLAYTREKLGGGHVSVERLVSGMGLVTILGWLEATGRAQASEPTHAAMLAEDDAAVIGRVGTEGSDAACRMAVDRFVRLYGAEAGNLALKSLPRGGLYVAGGIAKKILPRLREGFLPAFLAKGRMRPLLEAIPVHVILDGDVGLRGAAS
jgi:glucokinase